MKPSSEEKKTKEQEKDNSKKEAKKIISQLTHYAIYGSMGLSLLLILTVTVMTVIQRDSHDTRSRASEDQSSAPLTLISESEYKSADCYSENSRHERTWTGTLEPQESYTVKLPFCRTKKLGEIGFAVQMNDSTAQTTLSAVSPKGTIRYPEKSFESTQRLCILPGTTPIESGEWHVTVSNWEKQPTNTKLTINVGSATKEWVEKNCN